MKVKSQTTIIISICIVIAGIIITSVAGLWNTKSTKVPAKLKQNEYVGQYDPSDIRGSYSFSEISNLFSIPFEDLATAFNVEESVAKEFKCKELEGIFASAPNEIGTGSVKIFVAFYYGLPYNITGDTYITDSGAEILKRKSNMTSEQLAYLETHIVVISK